MKPPDASGRDRGSEQLRALSERLRLRCWELEVALDWYLQRIHELEAAVGVTDGFVDAANPRAVRPEPDRPKLEAIGDDAAQRHFDRIRLYEMELQALAARMGEQESLIADLSRDLGVQRGAAAERLQALEELSRERDLQAEVAADRLATIQSLAAEGEGMIQSLTKERDLQARAAEDRLAMLETVARERDAQTEVAAERLAAIEKLTRERDETIERLTRERDLQSRVAAERLHALEELSTERVLRSERPSEGWR